MNDGKGKGRAKASDDESFTTAADPSPPPSSSLLEKVAASATGLARSAFAAPGGNEISEAASGALQNSSKGQATRASSGSTWAESSNRVVQSGASTQIAQQLPSLRSGHRDEHVHNTESEFSSFLDGIDQFTPSNTETDEISSVERAWENAVAQENMRQQGHISVEEQQMHDGEAVVDLLSDPTASADTWDLSPEQDEIVNWRLTEEQLTIIRSMLNELFPSEEPHEAPRADHPLNLVPHFTSLNGEEGRIMWMEQWDGVLNRYTDEVWGDLLPLVQEAREEVQTMKKIPSGTVGEQPKALRRLGLILGHLR